MMKVLLILLLFPSQILTLLLTQVYLSQINEYRSADLSSFYGVATQQYNLTSSSPFSMIQPVQYQKSLLNLGAGKVLSSSILYLGEGEYLKAIVGKNNDFVYLSISLIEMNTEVFKSLTLLVTQDITLKNPFNPTVSLVNKQTGILSYQNNDNNVIALFTFIPQQLRFTTSQTQDALSTTISTIPTYDNMIYYLNFSLKDMTMYLYSLNQSNKQIVKVANQRVCSSSSNIQATSFNNNIGMIVIRCQYLSTSTSTFEEYSINQVNLKILMIQTETLNQYQIAEIKCVEFIENKFYILETFDGFPFNMQVTTLQKSYQFLMQKSIMLSSIESTSSFLGLFFSKYGDLITIITPMSVIGIRIKTQTTLFSFTLSSVSADLLVNMYYPTSATQFGDQIIICFEKTNGSQYSNDAISIATNIPVLNFIQQNEGQYYIFNQTFNGVTRKFNIMGNYFYLNNPPLTPINAQDYWNIMVENSTGIAQNNLNGRISGSNLIFQTTNTTTFNQVDCSFSLSTTSNKLFSTDKEGVIIVQTISSQVNKYSYQSLIQSSPIRFAEVTSFNSKFSSYQIDSSGSIVLSNQENYWTVNFLYLGVVNQFVPILTNCQYSQKFQISSDSSSQILATSCDSKVTIYNIFYDSSSSSFSFQSFDIYYSSPPSTIFSIQLYSSGLLVATDNTNVYGFDAINKIFLGQISVPQNYQTSSSQIYLFANSFIYTQYSSNIFQFSYNNFENQVATYLRQLMPCVNQLQSPFYGIGQAANRQYKNREFFMFPGYDSKQKSVFLIFKIETTSQDQLVVTTQTPSEQFNQFSTLSYFGYYLPNKNQIVLYQNFLDPILSFQYSFDPVRYQGTYQKNISMTILENVPKQNTTFYHQATNLTINPSAFNAYLNSSNQLSNLTTYFITLPLQKGSSVSFQDSSAFYSNLFGWQIVPQSSDLGLSAQVQQRVSITQNQDTYISMIKFYLPLAVYATKRTITCGDQILFNSDSDVSISLFIDISDQTFVQSNFQMQFYALILSELGPVYINEYKIYGTYTATTATLTTFSQNLYSCQTDIFKNNDLISILNINYYGLIAFIQPKTSKLVNLFYLNLDLTTFTLDSNSLSGISNLQIVGGFISDYKKNGFFFAINSIIYHKNENGFVTMDILDYLKRQCQIQLSQDSQITQVVNISNGNLLNGNFLIEFNESYLFRITISINIVNSGDITFTALQLYQQSDLMRFTGFAFQTLNKQMLIVSQFRNNKSNFILILFENRLIKSSAAFSIEFTPLKFQFVQLQNNYIQMLARGESSSINYSITLTDQVTITIQSVNLPAQFIGNAFGISPLYVPSLPSNTILFQAQNNTKQNIVVFGNLKSPIIWVLVLLFIGIE